MVKPPLVEPLLEVVAPGKLVLLGEYAVLDGAPAICLAVDRGVRCRVFPLQAGSQGVEVRVPGGDDRFARAALLTVDAPAACYVFTDENPPELPGKAGFGGSAAAVVAGVLAGGGRGSEAVEVHKRVQGSGSGIDVATIIAGGMVRFQAGAVTPMVPMVPLVVWSGKSASTHDRVQAWRAWGGDKAPFLQETTRLVELFPGDPVTATRLARRLLVATMGQAGVDYETPALARVASLAEERGGAARPSGAGGGDSAVAWLPDPESADDFRRACEAGGFALVDVRAAPPAAVIRRAPCNGGDET